MSSARVAALPDGRSAPVGNYYSEVAGTASALEAAGYELVYANSNGTTPATQGPIAGGPPTWSWPTAPSLRTFASLTENELSAFVAIFIPGGHAVMVDMWRCPELGRVLRHFHEAKKLTAAICNGPAALLSASLPADGRSGGIGMSDWPYSGYRMTAFSNAEWRLLETPTLAKSLPHAQTLLEASPSTPKANGAAFFGGVPATSRVVRDRELLTGGNPFSVGAFTEKLLDGLRAQC